MSLTPPGWYPDSEGVVRWYDGTRWTEHVHEDTVPRGVVNPRAPEPEPEPPRRRTGLFVALGAAALVVVGVVVVALLVAIRTGEDPDDRVGDVPAPTTATSEPTTEPGTPDPTTTPTTPTTPATPGPDEVAEIFLEAIVQVDCPTAELYSTPAFLEREGGCEDDLPPDALRGATVQREPAAVAGASATVAATITVPGGDGVPGTPLPLTVTLVETAFGWRVNDLVQQ